MNSSKLAKLANLLLSHLQDEQAVQMRLLILLRAQEAAALKGDTEKLTSTTGEVEQELNGESIRQQRRSALLTAFEGELGVPERMLTVGSLIERLEQKGVHTAGLVTVRAELKAALLDVRKLSQKLKVIARGHGEVLDDVLRALAGNGERALGIGILVNAEV